MKLTNFNVLTLYLKDKLHQWFLGPEGQAASVVLGTVLSVLGAHHPRHGSLLHPGVTTTRFHWHDRNGIAHPIMSNEAVASVFWPLANKLQGVVTLL